MNFGIADRSVDAETQVVEPRGEIDMATAPLLGDVLEVVIESGKRRLVVDLADVRFIDSTGLRVLCAARDRVRQDGGVIVTVCPDPTVRRIFEMTGMVDVLNVTASRREALAVVARSTL